MDFEAAAKEFTRSAEGAEGDTAMARKRSRRVSFADTTAIHVFDRDEDYDTPPDTKPGAEGPSGAGLGSEPLGLYGDFTDNLDAKSLSRREEDVDDDEEQDGGEEEHQLFVRRDAYLSSPGSLSNDDDNIFGPVSTSFIRSGRMSEVSDDNDHDITLDSTAFSMHFSNILPFDDRSVNTEGTPRTPTEDYVAKDCGAFVPLSGTKRKVLDFTLPNGKSSGATGYSSDMSLVAENSRSYDYEKLLPTLEVLLAKVNEVMHPQKQNDMSSLSCSPNTGTGPPAGASIDKIEQNTKNAAHKAEELPNLVPGNASDMDIISLPKEHSQNCYSLPRENMPVCHLKDGTRENESCSNFFLVSASVVPALVTPDTVQIASESECRTHTPTGIQNGTQHICSPLGSSISSLLTKRRQLFEDDEASVSLQSRSMTQTPNSVKGKIALNSERTSIIKNSGSKFETFEGEDSLGSRSRMSLLADHHRLSGFKAALDTSGNYNCLTHLNTSLSQVGEQLSTAGEVTGLEMNSKMHIPGCETPSSLRESGWNEEGKATSETSKETEGMIQIPGTGVQKVEKSLWSENPVEGASSILNSAKQKMLDVKENRQLLNTFSKLVSSPMSLMGQKHAVPQDQCFTPLSSGSFIPNSLLKEVRSEVRLSRVTSSSIQTRKPGNQNVTSEASTVSQVTEKESMVIRGNLSPVSQDRDLGMWKVPDNIMEKIAGGRPAVPDASKKVMTVKDSEQVMTYRSSPRVPNYIEGNNISKPFHLMNAGSRDSMASNNMGSHHDIYSPKEPLFVLDDDVVQNKRISEEVPLANDVSNVPGRTLKSLKIVSDTKANIAAFSPAQQRQHIVGDDGAVGHLVWAGLLKKIIEDTKEPFSLSVNKPTLMELDVLEDLAGELQKAGKFERLCSDVQTLGTSHDLGQQKRLSDIRLLKETLLYEQAKLQLKSIKRDRLLKRTHDLQSRIHNFCQLRSSFKQMRDKTFCPLPVSDPNVMVQDEHDKVLTMKQKLQMLDEKIKGFVNFFGTSCKIDKNLGCDEMVKAICDILDKRNHSRVIRRHLQLWKLIDVVNQNDQYDIIINYCNILAQRFTIMVTPSTRFGVEVSLDDAKIEKRFPNMKVSTAFHFLFIGMEGHKRLTSIRCFQRETQIVTDNASYNIAAGRMLMEKRKKLFWTPCSAHCLDLMLEDIGKMKEYVGIITKVKKLTAYVYTHTRLLDHMRKETKGKELVRFGVTRFATTFLTLERLFDESVKRGLRRLFSSNAWYNSTWAKTNAGKNISSIVYQVKFWHGVEEILRACQPILQVLRLVDGDEKPAMGYLYAAMEIAKKQIMENFSTKQSKYQPILKIVDKRWKDQMNRPLHEAGFFLNPKLFFEARQKDVTGVTKFGSGFMTCLEKMVPDKDVQDKIGDQMMMYMSARGSFGNPMAIRARERRLPTDWWLQYGVDTPELQKIALRILGLCCSSSGCERNCSVFKFIHTKKRNRLEHKRLNDLVFVQYNRRLRERFIERKNHPERYDPICLEELDWGNSWMTKNGEDLVHDGDDLTWEDVDQATGASSERVRRGKHVGTSSQSMAMGDDDEELLEEEEEEEEEEVDTNDDDGGSWEETNGEEEDHEGGEQACDMGDKDLENAMFGFRI